MDIYWIFFAGLALFGFILGCREGYTTAQILFNGILGAIAVSSLMWLPALLIISIMWLFIKIFG